MGLGVVGPLDLLSALLGAELMLPLLSLLLARLAALIDSSRHSSERGEWDPLEVVVASALVLLPWGRYAKEGALDEMAAACCCC